MPFTLERVLAKLVNLNPRQEMHGDDHVLGLDIKMTVMVSNTELAEFSPTLCDALYCKSDSQHHLESVPEVATQLKNPQLGKLKWDANKYDNARFVVHHGIDGTHDTIFATAKVNKFELEPKEGGTVSIGYRVQVNPTEQDVAKLSSVLGEEVYVSLDPEGGDDQEDDDDKPYVGGDSNDGYTPPADQSPPAAKTSRGGRRSRSQMALVE